VETRKKTTRFARIAVNIKDDRSLTFLPRQKEKRRKEKRKKKPAKTGISTTGREI